MIKNFVLHCGNDAKLKTLTKGDSTIGRVLTMETFFKIFVIIFLSCFLADPRLTLGHYRGYRLTHPMLITAF